MKFFYLLFICCTLNVLAYGQATPTCVTTSSTTSWTSQSGSGSQGAAAFTVTGFSGSNLNDAAIQSSYDGTTGYLDRVPTMTTALNLRQGDTYASSVTWGSTSSKKVGQVWIDFNDDGTFASSEAVTTVWGYASTVPQPATFNIVIPTSANPGVHRMRCRAAWIENSTDLGYAPSDIDPCLRQFPSIGLRLWSGTCVDYKVNIISLAPVVTATPSPIAFGGVTVDSSAVTTFSMSAISLNAGGGTLTLTAPTGYKISPDGILWYTTYGITYTGTSLSATTVYVKFSPTALTSYTGNITVTGGGIVTAATIPVSGTGATACSSTPTPGTAWITPPAGGSTTTFSMSLFGTSLSGGLTYQWQSSSSPTSGFTDIAGATTSSYSFSGLTANMYFKAIVTCPSYTPAASNTVAATYVSSYGFTGTIGRYVVPAGVTSLNIIAKGAQGGATSYFSGGLGANMNGNFTVSPGQVLNYIVGEMPTAVYYNAGGGGGTFVWDSATSTPLIVGGGGGGAGYSGTTAGANANVTTSGTNSPSGASGAGTSGSGGVAASFTYYAGGGAGWTSNGVNSNYSSCSIVASGGVKPLSGGTGGSYGGNFGYDGSGGFGGGGGGFGMCYAGGSGGGGGYSGGGPGGYTGYYAGGGGGSYNSGTSQVNSIGNTGNGSVTITPLGNCIVPYAQATSLTFSSTLSTITGTFSNAIPTPLGYLVVMTTSSVAPTAPTSGTIYAIGDTSLGGRVVSNDNSTTFNVTGLPTGTSKWFWVYSYNGLCAGAPKYLTTSPLNGTTATLNCSLSGTKTVGPTGDYSTIAAALSACNTLGVSGPVTIEIQTAYTGESFPINIGSYPCISATNNITIRPQGAMTITATGSVINMNGARYVTIDGRSVSGTGKELTIKSTSTSAPAIQFGNEASYNTIKNCIIRSSNISTSTTTMGAINFGTTTGVSGNDYNIIDSCDITSQSSGSTMAIGIYSNGTTNKENSYNTISNCNIYDYYYTGYYNFGVWLSSNNNNWTITNNRFFQTGSRSYTGCWYNGAIYVSPGTSGNSSGFIITNNTIGYASASGTGVYTATSSTCDYYRWIWTSVGIAEPTIISGNTITAISATASNSASTSGGMFTGVLHNGGSANIDSNIIGAPTGNGAITVTVQSSGGTVVGISTTASVFSMVTPAIVNIRKNKIGSITVNGSSSTIAGAVHGIQASSTASVLIQKNLIGSTTTANSLYAQSVNTSGNQHVYGINSQVTTTLVTPPVIDSNIIANLTGMGTSSSNMIAGIVHASGSASVTVTNNTIYNIKGATGNTVFSSQVGVGGIVCTPSSTTATAEVSGNNVHTIQNTNTTSSATTVAGILYSAATNGTISKNIVYDLRNAGTASSSTSPAKAIGIFVYQIGGGSSNYVNVINNMVSLGNGQTTTTSFTGIMQGVTSNSAKMNVYHNSVNIEGAAASGSIHTAAFMRGHYSGTVTTPVDIRNNIFVNNRTNSTGTGKHYAIADAINYSASSTGWGSGASNYNILNAATSSTVGWWNGSDQTFASWQSNAVCDGNSYASSAVTFMDPANGDLHINMGTTANNIESHGTTISGVNQDIDGDIRPGPVSSVNGGGFAPDLGADEFDGKPNDNIPPAITYTTLTNSCGTDDRTFTATLADPAGIPTTGTLRPRVYYRKNGGTWYSGPGSLTTGTTYSGTWTFSIVGTDMGSVSIGDIVDYFVIAQDSNGFVGSNSSGMSATDVNTIATYPTVLSTYSVLLNMSGTYNVGTGGDYSTITDAVNAYNGACLSGPVTFSLISSTYASETFPIQINGNSFANATNTLTILPDTGTAVSIDDASSPGAIFKFLNARWVTIDGVNSGGASLTLNSTYTSTFANIWLASSSSVGPGCRNITLKNMFINGGTNTTTNYGILAGMDNGTFPTTSGGMDNDSIIITGNTITKCYYGIYANGTNVISAGGLNAWNISNNTFGPESYSSTDNIGIRGILLSNMIGPVIANNAFHNLGTTSISTQVAGVYLSSNINGATVTQNRIGQITSNGCLSTTSGNCGIYMGSSVQNVDVTRNIISDINDVYPSGCGTSHGIIVTTGQPGSNILIANNMISYIRAKASSGNSYYPSGILIGSGSTGNVKIYHNTIYLSGNYAGYNTATGSACLLSMSTSNNIDVRNNIFYNSFNNTTTGSDKGWAIYTNQASGSNFSYLDNNDYYVSGPNVLGYLSGDKTDLTSLQSAFGGNASSISTEPIFNDTTDLYLQVVPENVPLLSGTPLTVVPKDIDDTLRSTTNPVLGAQEVKIPPCNTVTLTAGTPTPITGVLCTQGTTTILPAGATSALNISYQWLSSEDSSSWSAISGATTRNYTLGSPITGTTFYRLRIGCTTTSQFDSATTKVIVNPSRIQGGAVVCAGLTTTLSDTTAGGIWSSSSSSVAEIVDTTGVVTGIAAGTATITYTVLASGCYATKVVLVHPLPDDIFGVASMCEGFTTTLINTTGGGTWSSGTTAIATVDTSGVVSGIAAGISVITYTLPTGCIKTVPTSVNPLPVMTILPAPSTTICFGDTAHFKGSAFLPEFSLLNQNFNSGLGLWQVNNIAGTSTSYWQIYPTGYGSISGDGSPMMVSASETTGGTPTNTILTSPSFSTVGYGTASLTFNQDIISITPDDIEASVEYSVNGGATWTSLADMLDVIESSGTWSSSSPQVTVALPSGMLGEPDVRLRWKYNTNFGFWWAIDNIVVKAALPDPTYTWAALGTATGLSCTGCDSTNITPSVAGVNLYSVTATTASGCVSTGGLTSVYVNPQPAAIGGTPVVCEGANTTLTNAMFGGSWTSDNTSIATVNTLTGVVHGELAGNTVITYTLPSGCKVTTPITVNAAPSAITGTMNVCSGFTTSLSSTTTGGVWSSGASGTATVDASGIVTGGGAGIAPISYTLSSTTGCSAVANVTVNPYPAVITTTATSFEVCEAGTINLSSASLGGTWSSSASSTAAIDAGSGILTGGTAGVATISYTLPTGCVRTQDVTVNPTPAAITGAGPVCQFSTITLASTSTGGSWSSASPSIASVDATGVVTGGTNAGIASINYTLPTGCKTSANVTVNQLPSAITGSLQVCEGQTTPLFNAATGGTWVSSVTSVAAIDPSTGVVTAGPSGSAGNTMITYTLPTGCYQTAEVTVNPLPSPITGSLAVCQGSSTPLSSLPAGGTWTSGVTGVATIGASSGIATGSATMAGISIIEYVLPGGCSVTANLTVNPLPAPITSSTGSMQVCEGSVAVLSNTSTGGTWVSSNTTVANIGATTGVALGGTMGTTSITYTLTSTGCARTSVLTVNQSPSAIGGTLAICEGTGAPLTNTVSGGVWSSNTPSVAIITSGGVVAGVNYGTSVITYMVTPGNCYKTAVVTVNQLPAVISGIRQVCLGSTTALGNATSGGTWSSSNATVAAVSATGVVTGSSIGTASIVYTLPTGCTMSAVVTVNALPAAITGTDNVCVGLTTALGNTSTGGTWSSNNVTVAPVNATTGVVTGIVAGTSTITYSLPTGCISTANVTVNALPAAITGSTQVCEGSTTALGSATGGLTWSSGTTAVATVDPSTGVVTGNLPGTTVITGTSLAGCTRTAVITVNSLPAAITGSSAVCQGQTTPLSSTTTGGVWSSSTPSVATITASSGVLTGTGAGSTQVTYTIATGCKAVKSVVVNPLPAVITGSAQVCTGQNTTLGNTTTGGTWSSATPAIATIDAAGVVYGAGAGSSNIAYTSVDGCVRNVVVTVNQLPSPVTGTPTACVGGTTVMSNTVAGGAWSSSTPGVANVNLLTGTVTGVAAGNANITYTLLTGCYQSATITVNPLPAAITGTPQVCPGSTTALGNTTTGGTWSSSSTGIASVSATGVVSGIAAGTTSIMYTLPTGCAKSQTVVVNSLPVVRTVSGGGSYCAGGTGVNVILDGSAIGENYQLYMGTTMVGTAAAGTGSAITFGPLTAAGTYTVAASNPATACGSNMSGSANVSITPVNVPAVSITTGVGDTVCAGNVTTFNANPIDGGSAATYVWRVNGILQPSTTTAHTYSPSNGDVITVTLNSSAPCSIPASVTSNFTMNVKPNVTPVVSVTSTGNNVCKGSSVTFNAAATYGGSTPTYNWYINGFWAGAGNTFGYIPTNGQVVLCRMNSNYMCRLVDSVASANQNMVTNEVFVPVVHITADPGTTIAYGQSATFTATAIGAGPTPAYQWYNGGSAQAGATNATFTTSGFNTGDSVICKVIGSGPCGFSTFNGVMITAYDLGTGTVTLGNANVALVPNPNKGAFTVKGTLASDKDEEVMIEVTNMLGQNVYRSTVTAKGGNINEQILLNNTLANGMYMLSLHAGNESKVFHFVLEQ